MRLLCMHMHSPRTRCDDSAIVFACEFPLRLLCRAFVGACASFAVRDFVVSHFCSIFLRVLRVSLSCGVFGMQVYPGIAVFSMKVTL